MRDVWILLFGAGALLFLVGGIRVALEGFRLLRRLRALLLAGKAGTGACEPGARYLVEGSVSAPATVSDWLDSRPAIFSELRVFSGWSAKGHVSWRETAVLPRAAPSIIVEPCPAAGSASPPASASGVITVRVAESTSLEAVPRPWSEGAQNSADMDAILRTAGVERPGGLSRIEYRVVRPGETVLAVGTSTGVAPGRLDAELVWAGTAASYRKHAGRVARRELASGLGIAAIGGGYLALMVSRLLHG